jgi:hypothetical protein
MNLHLEAKTLFIAMLVGVAHIVSGISVLVSPSVWSVTPLSALPYIVSLAGYGQGMAGTILIGAGLMAVIGSNLSLAMPRTTHGFLFIPQEILLLLQLWAIVMAMMAGQYPDGYLPTGGSWFILTDQIWAFILAVTHSLWLAAFLYGSNDRGILDSPA